MTKQEAQNEAYRIWLTWEDRRKKSNCLGLMFYGYLTKYHPHVLSFRTNGDPYQTVNAWVNSWIRLDKIQK